MKHNSDPNNYSVYVHIVPNGKLYIGITGQKPIYRWDNGNGYKKTPQFWTAIEEYGWDNIKHLVLITGLKKEIAKACEIALIDKYHSNDPEYGYNIALGSYHAEESKRKNALAHIGKQYHLGFKASEESRKRMSEAHKGVKLSESRRIESLAYLEKARKNPEIETRRRENIRKAHLGVKRGPWSEEARVAHMAAIERRKQRRLEA